MPVLPFSKSPETGGFAGLIGIAKVDLTPDLKVPLRNWGAARTEKAQGVHRPLEGRVLWLEGEEPGESAGVWISLNLGWWKTREAEIDFRRDLSARLPSEARHLILHLTHTHAGPTLIFDETASAAAAVIATDRAQLLDALARGVEKARAARQNSRLSWRYGHCGLAANRDLRDPFAPQRYVCAWNPETTADQTLLVGHVTDGDDRVTAILVNYACHPTTLGWNNTHFSPDFVGALESTVEAHFSGSSCLFIQGASGNLAPRRQYVEDLEQADRHGLELAYAVLSTVEGMSRSGHVLAYRGTVESGAPLGIWEERPIEFSRAVRHQTLRVVFRLKDDLPTPQDIDQVIARTTDPVESERLRRLRGVRGMFGENAQSEETLHLWQWGNTFVCAHPFEAYASLQTRLRARFPDLPIVVANLSNGWRGYLPDAALYSENLYSVTQTPFAAGGLERLFNSFSDAIESLRPSTRTHHGTTKP
jgi:hypothetical protein